MLRLLGPKTALRAMLIPKVRDNSKASKSFHGGALALFNGSYRDLYEEVQNRVHSSL